MCSLFRLGSPVAVVLLTCCSPVRMDPGDGGVGGGGGAGGGEDGGPDCAVDYDKLGAAHDAIADGGTDVELTACLRYRRTGAVVELLNRGVVEVRTEPTDGGEVRRRDRDGDGVFDWTMTSGKGATVDTEWVEIQFTGKDGGLSRRERYDRLDATDVQAVIEEADATGALNVLESSIRPVNQPASAMIALPAPGAGAHDCTPQQLMVLGAAMRDAIFKGPPCFTRKGLREGNDILLRAAGQGVRIVCGDLGGLCAEEQWWNTWFGSRLVIGIDPAVFFDPNRCGSPVSILWHELVHTQYGAHSPYNRNFTAEDRVQDKMYACASMCFDSAATQCQCASCLGTCKTDPRCAGYAACPDLLGVQCRCLANPRWYPSEAACTSDCRSGLSCYAAGCSTVDYRCP